MANPLPFIWSAIKGITLFGAGAATTWAAKGMWDNFFGKKNKQNAKQTQDERELRKQSALEFMGAGRDDASNVETPLSPV